MSVGLEDVEDLRTDLDGALGTAAHPHRGAGSYRHAAPPRGATGHNAPAAAARS
jgi:methionine-gamma-lyase